MREMQALLVAVLAAAMLLVGSSVVAAMDDASMSAEQMCKQEGEDSGIIDQEELNDYVASCIASLPSSSDDAEMDSDHEFMNNSDDESSMSD